MATNNLNESPENDVSLWDKIITLPQYLIPHYALSALMHRLARSQIVWFKNCFIRFITAQYKVDINEAENTDLNSYISFNAFFTRQLQTGARVIAQGDKVISSPVDGVISQIGLIEQGKIIQAKGQLYTVLELLGGDNDLAQQFEQGQFTTLYLSPKDYHRIHMPLTGQLQQMRYIPGKLFSVSPRTVRAVPNIFARNERVVTVFETDFGPLIMVLIGAIFVGSMETIWSGQITPADNKEMRHWYYQGDEAITIEKGDEMGRFNMGSTVVLLLAEQAPQFKVELIAKSAVHLGQALS